MQKQLANGCTLSFTDATECSRLLLLRIIIIKLINTVSMKMTTMMMTVMHPLIHCCNRMLAIAPPQHQIDQHSQYDDDHYDDDCDADDDSGAVAVQN